jgi:hypothetical protein
MNFTPITATLWLAERHDSGAAAGRIVGWDTSDGRPVPVVMWTDDDNQVTGISTPETSAFFVGDSYEDAIRMVPRGKPRPVAAESERLEAAQRQMDERNEIR